MKKCIVFLLVCMFSLHFAAWAGDGDYGYVTASDPAGRINDSSFNSSPGDHGFIPVGANQGSSDDSPGDYGFTRSSRSDFGFNSASKP